MEESGQRQDRRPDYPRKRSENVNKAITWHTAMKSSLRIKLKKRGVDLAKEKLEKAKACVRAKVEHCFHVVKCLFNIVRDLSEILCAGARFRS